MVLSTVWNNPDEYDQILKVIFNTAFIRSTLHSKYQCTMGTFEWNLFFPTIASLQNFPHVLACRGKHQSFVCMLGLLTWLHTSDKILPLHKSRGALLNVYLKDLVCILVVTNKFKMFVTSVVFSCRQASWVLFSINIKPSNRIPDTI